MSRDEFYKAVSKLGKKAIGDESVMYKSGKLFYRYIGISVDGVSLNSAHSYEEALEQFAALEPAKAKADRIAKLKAEIAELES